MVEQMRQGQDAATALRPLLTGYWLSQALLVAAELGVADRLADGPLSCGVLAQQVGADEDALYRVLRALAGAGVFTESAPRTFALTALAEPLRTDHPRSVRPLARLFRQEWLWRPWGQLLEAVQTGSAVFQKIHGAPFFAYLGEHPDAAAVFDAAMTAGAPAGRSALAEAYDFAPLRTVVDIGGGEGALLAALLRSHPHLQGILFDQPAVVAGASAHLQAAGVAERCQIVGGDFFAAVPEGGDAYVLSQILHDWDDARATVILKNCHRAGHPGARVIAVERVLPPGDAPHPGKLTDLNMLVLLAGRERTEAEYRALFAAAGFELTRSVPLPEGGWSAVEGIRA
ncbi:MAG: acetylserotonin O-methyltransferase [Chloroflexota bacterium]|nr:acetylserotonin O-methyltransferase [Chloroflexota bacterium]